MNYGKTCNIGKYEVKEFETEERCCEEAERLIRSKMRKGYVEDAGFGFIGRLYIDSEEFGLHPKASHPRYVGHFVDAIYYSEIDEDAPFGSDEGNDTLKLIFEAIGKNPRFDFSAYPRKLIERDWGVEYVPVDTLDADEIGKLAAHKETDMIQSDTATYATAFAQIKITGSVASDLKTRAIETIRRLAAIEGHSWTENEVCGKMIGDLRSFDHATDDRYIGRCCGDRNAPESENDTGIRSV